QFQSIPSPPSGKKRTFVLASRGRYERITDSSRFQTYSQPEISSFGLNTIYPNPFNPITTISFQQPVDGYTQVIIYDLLGREVARLIDANTSKGSYTVNWDASYQSNGISSKGGYASGVYFCRFIVSNSAVGGKVLYNEVKKLIVTK
ncbi:MAG: T9SS type A sorting domain-containing protein, partial [Bacteroidota bacterium]|nr:T9SS type A sorting domain-containing protein [Bacteroidota bacterium]